MKKTATLVTLLLLFQISFAQQSRFSKTYYDNITSFTANCMARSFDGGLIVCGLYNYESAVMKIDSLGAMQWANKIGFGSNESFNSVIRTTDSCYVMAGKILNSGSGTLDIYIAKIDQAGNLLWSKTIYQTDHQEALSIQQTFDGGFIITGYSSYLTAPNSKIVVLKLDLYGAVEWNNLYQGGNNSNYGASVKQTPDSGYAFVGYVENYPPYDGNGILCKLSQTGTVEWANKYNLTIPTQAMGNDLVVADDGIYSYYSTPGEFILVKTDFNGIDNWRETIGGLSFGSLCINCPSPKMKLLPDGNLIFATGTLNFAQPSAVVNIDSAGNYNWSQYLYNSVHDVEQADDHGFFFLGNGPLIGVRATSILNPHVGIIKSDSLGNADLCTTPNGAIGVNFGNTTQGALVLTTTSYVGNSLLISPNVTPFVLSEQVSCVDFSGGIDEGSGIDIKVYPNPAGSSFSIQMKGLSGEVNLRIVDILGQVVFVNEYNLSNENEIKINQDLSKGVYSILVNSGDRKIVNKLIVQ